MIADSPPPVDPSSVNPGSFTPTVLTPARLRSLIGEHFPDAPHAIEDLNLRAFARAVWQEGRRAGARSRPRRIDRADLAAAGYVEGPPSAQAAGFDRGAAAASACERCGHRGLVYVPFTRADPPSYRAFARCPQCGEAIEF